VGIALIAILRVAYHCKGVNIYKQNGSTGGKEVDGLLELPRSLPVLQFELWVFFCYLFLLSGRKQFTKTTEACHDR
jgi:hypothetical protein